MSLRKRLKKLEGKLSSYCEDLEAMRIFDEADNPTREQLFNAINAGVRVHGIVNMIGMNGPVKTPAKQEKTGE